jgi:hypothetical protein
VFSLVFSLVFPLRADSNVTPIKREVVRNTHLCNLELRRALQYST